MLLVEIFAQRVALGIDALRQKGIRVREPGNRLGKPALGIGKGRHLRKTPQDSSIMWTL